MFRVLGMRLMTRILLLVCSLSLVSILFLSRCGLNNLEPETEEQDTQVALPGNGISFTLIATLRRCFDPRPLWKQMIRLRLAR